jgi:UDP-N-acetylglucosamine 2-epimerase (non-hydrolysing)
MHILHVVGARPNYMKVAPVHRALAGLATQTIVHTGQHYDVLMSDIFFRQLDLKDPDINLEVGSGTHAAQTGQIMIRLEPVLLQRHPDFVVVYGDVNSTVAATLVCSKLLIPIAHVEAGLRSRDRSMPEEVNRLVTDALADLLFTPSADADENLAAEGVDGRKVHLVGNVMIDSLIRLLPNTEPDRVREQLGIGGAFALVTLHRPSNVDDPAALRVVLDTLGGISERIEVVFPMHPRTRARVSEIGFTSPARLRFVEPLGYLEFLALQQRAAVVITDSGGIQEETTFLGVPCITVRTTTERPVTVTLGTNVLVGGDMTRLCREVELVLDGRRARGSIPPLWDGHAGSRIASTLAAAGRV